MNKHNYIALLICALALVLSACGSSSSSSSSEPPPPPPPPPPPAAGEWTLVWSDEFEGDSIDMTKWSHEVNCWGGGNDELQCYTDRPENSYVEDGRLHLVVREETFSGPAVNDDHPSYDPDSTAATRNYTSARLRTVGKGDWKYGRIEVNARMPEGQGMWPAIWMLPTDWVHGGWPMSGEIDIFEAVNPNGTGGNEIYGTLHYGRAWPNNVHSGTGFTPNANIWEEFHTYAIEWEEGEIRWYVDDTHYATQTDDGWFTFYWGGQEVGYILGEGAAPFDEAFHLLLNVAVGGHWPGFNIEADLPQMMVVDYVRVYECSVDPETGRGCASNVDSSVHVDGHPAQQRSFNLFQNGPATLNLTAHGSTVNNTLVPAYWEATGGNIVSDPNMPADDDTVWDVQFNGPGNIFLLSGDMSEVNHVDDGLVFSGMHQNSEIIFEMRVLDIEESTDLQVKLDSGWPNVSFHTITTPPAGEWTTVSVRIAQMSPNNIETGQVNLSDIVAPFVLEAVGGTAHVQLNNIRIRCLSPCGINPQLDGTVPDDAGDLQIYVGGLADDWSNPGWGIWQQQGQNIIRTMVEDSEKGIVPQYEFQPVGEGIMYIQSVTPQDLSAFSGGAVKFDLKVINAGSNTSGFRVKADCVFPCTSNEIEVPMPPDGEWHAISVPISVMTAGSGFNITNVNTPFAFFPVFGQQGVTFRLANIRWTHE